ncbi:MAG: oligopeptidase B [Candidatus Riflebacteria bacterium HGW-Riflebacteria-1]|jgi:oligopeptidase B|nr:MAG: oligopeptidase B [Candidatus Riflebacteria bacterium HGW-Riflebacteria-1]
MKLYLLLSVIVALCLPAHNGNCEAPVPPSTRQQPNTREIHGVTLTDPYAWLRNKESKEVLSHLKNENLYTSEIMKDTEEQQVWLFEEMKSRIKETDLSVPQQIDSYYYYSRTEQGKQYRIHCRRGVEAGSPEEIIFDENKYAEGTPYFAMGALEISPDHNILAYSIDNNGAEKFELGFINLITGETYPDKVASTTYGVVWAEDNKTVFYTLMDDTGRACLIKKHKLGASIADDKEVYHEQDGQFWAGISKTRDRKYLLLGASSSTSSEYRILEASNPDGEFRVFRARQKGIEYGLIHQNEYFYILTNENAVNFKVMRTRDNETAPEKWQEFIAARDDVLIDDVDAFAGHLVVAERENGLQKIRYFDNAGKSKFIPFNEAVYSVTVDDNPEYKTTKLRYRYTSLTTPESVFDFDMVSEKAELKKQTEVLGTFSSANYQSERIFAKAADGTMVPISLVYRKDMRKKGPAKAYLTGYGSYGSSFDPYFSSIRLSLLDRGFIYAIAHVRGGQEMGRPWYDNGKLLNKKNTFTDFIVCAEHLIELGYTDKDLLVINGGSAGGLLMGAVVNMRPGIFKAVIADVPFVDVINTMLDPSLPLVREEYEEWGNPEIKEYFDYILSYSPYDNIKAQDYPAMLVTAGLNDPRVSFWEPAKFVARLRTMKTDQNLLLLKTNLDAGHAGASGRYDFIKEIAFEYAFIFKILNVKF